MTSWERDPSLDVGSAPYYAARPASVSGGACGVVRDELDLDARGRLLDVGCGPGSQTHLLASLVEEALGIDADAEMVHAAEAAAAANERFVSLRAAALPAGLRTFRGRHRIPHRASGSST